MSIALNRYSPFIVAPSVNFGVIIDESVMTPPPKRPQTHSNYETVSKWNNRFFLWAIFCWWCILNCWLKPLAMSHACTSAGGDWKFKGADVSAVRGGVRRAEPLFLDSRSSSSSFIIRTGRAQNYAHSRCHIFPCHIVHCVLLLLTSGNWKNNLTKAGRSGRVMWSQFLPELCCVILETFQGIPWKFLKLKLE